MKNLMIIVVVCTILIMLSAIAYAAYQRIVLIDSNEQAFGTTANPIYVQGV